MSTPQPPSVDQLAAARLAHWRQNAEPGADSGEVLLTLDAARQFVSTCGLLLFTPRPQLLNSPAPSFVEATLGVTNTTPSLAEVSEARTLLARLVAEGSAVPLNLLGAPSVTPDTPDFIASAATFAYVFTLRGEKAFKQLPATSGPTKVTPLALNTYNLLVEDGPSSASDLAALLGKEITEAAVLRALNELWQHLRILPVPQPEGGPTVWETVTNRFTKQLKAGANAGQPSALSALISLYLSQALLATENDVETFLSPLAPRSRIRDVLHALSGARQLESIAVEGKTHLHIHGELSAFSTTAPAQMSAETDSPAATIELSEDGTRIKKFVAKPRKIGTGYVERAKPFRSKVPFSREARPFERRGSSQQDGEKSRSGGPNRTFNKPWEEEKRERFARSAGDKQTGDVPATKLTLDAASAPSRERRPGSAPGGFKRSFGAEPGSDRGRSGFSPRPKFGGDRPSFSRNREQGPTDSPRLYGGSGGRSTPSETRKPYPKAGFGGRKEGSFRDNAAPGHEERRPSRRDTAERGDRPPRREFSGRQGGQGGPGRPGFSKPTSFGERSGGSPDRSGRPERPPFRKFDAPRGPRKPFPPREQGSSGPTRSDSSEASRPYSPSRSGPSRGGAAGDRRDGNTFGRRDAGPKREGTGFAGKKPFGSKTSAFGKKPFGSRTQSRNTPDAPGASTFDKFKGGNKPWGKRPPGRKPKPEGEA